MVGTSVDKMEVVLTSNNSFYNFFVLFTKRSVETFYSW